MNVSALRSLGAAKSNLRRIGVALAIGLSLSAHAGSGDTVRAYPAAEVAPGVHVITGPLGEPSVENQGFMNNPAWIVAGNGIVVVDPGSSVQAGRMVAGQIRKSSKLPVVAVFNTHVHGDHWLGNQAILDAWPNAQIYAHPDMIALARGSQGEFWTTLMAKLTDGYTAGTEARIPTHAVKDGDTLTFGPVSFRVYLSNDAHSRTDIMLMTGDGVLFTGDNVLNGRVARMDDGTFLGNLREIDRAIALKPRVVVPGHGNTGGQELLTAQRDYFHTLYETVGTLYDEGLADYEMKPKVIEALSRFAGWHDFDANLGRQISLAVSEFESQ